MLTEWQIGHGKGKDKHAQPQIEIKKDGQKNKEDEIMNGKNEKRNEEDKKADGNDHHPAHPQLELQVPVQGLQHLPQKSANLNLFQPKNHRNLRNPKK